LLQDRKRKLMMLTVPGLLLIAMFIFVPMVNGFRVALYQWNGYGKNMKFIGLENFKMIFTKDARITQITINTLIYGIGSCLLQNILGLAAAIFVDRKFKGRNTIRAIIYMPIMISGFVFGKIMAMMFDYNNGVINDMLRIFFGMKENIYFMQNHWVGTTIITLVNSWQYLGLCMLIYLAGLQGISTTYLEAAAIDGASPWQRFIHIMLPLLIPSITTAVVTNLIGGLKLYEMVVGLTGGGPDRQTMSLAQYIQVLYFTDERAGYAAAVGLFQFALIMVLALPLNSYFKSREVYQ